MTKGFFLRKTNQAINTRLTRDNFQCLRQKGVCGAWTLPELHVSSRCTIYSISELTGDFLLGYPHDNGVSMYYSIFKKDFSPKHWRDCSGSRMTYNERHLYLSFLCWTYIVQVITECRCLHLFRYLMCVFGKCFRTSHHACSFLLQLS